MAVTTIKKVIDVTIQTTWAGQRLCGHTDSMSLQPAIRNWHGCGTLRNTLLEDVVWSAKVFLSSKWMARDFSANIVGVLKAKCHLQHNHRHIYNNYSDSSVFYTLRHLFGFTSNVACVNLWYTSISSRKSNILQSRVEKLRHHYNTF